MPGPYTRVAHANPFNDGSATDGAAVVNSMQVGLEAVEGSLIQTGSIVVWGDSTFANGGGDDAVGTATSRLVRSRGPWGWALTRLNQRGNVVHNGGVGGERSDQILARFAADVSAYNPGIVVMGAGINDNLQLVTTTAGTIASTLATVQANILSMISLVRGIGARPVLTTLPPNSGYITNQINFAAQLNRWIKSLAFTMDGVHICDWSPTVSALTTGAWASSMNYDNNHANTAGAARMGLALSTVLDQILPVTDVLPPYPDSLDWAVGGFQDGTAGGKGAGVTGSVASSWTAANLNGSTTAVGSKVARTDNVPGEWQQYAVSAGTGMRHYQDLASGYAAGDILYALVEFQNVSLTGHSDFFAEIAMSDGSAIARSITTAATGDSLADSACTLANGVFRTWPLLVPTIGANTMRVAVKLDGSGTGTFRIGRITVKKVGQYSG